MKRKTYIGVWEIAARGAEYECQLAITHAEYATLKADAAKAGITIPELMRERVFPPPSTAEHGTDVLLWPALCTIAAEQGITVDHLCADISDARPEGMTLVHALRCYVVGHFGEKLAGDNLWQAILTGTLQ